MNGLLLIDKPEGITSHDVINQMRRLTNQKRIGHTGTLDPFATGLMVVLFGQATKLSKYFVEKDKIYSAQIRLGCQTDTDDITGKMINQMDPSDLSEEVIREAIQLMVGPQKQVPPNYSAIKVGGHKMYELARHHHDLPDLDARDIEIYDFRVSAVERKSDYLLVDTQIEVSKGTYVRSIARDLGTNLGSYGTLNALRRIHVGLFNIEDAIPLEQLTLTNIRLLNPLDYMQLPKLQISESHALDVSYGRFLPVSLFSTLDDTILYNESGEGLAIYTYDETKNVMRMSVLLN